MKQTNINLEFTSIYWSVNNNRDSCIYNVQSYFLVILAIKFHPKINYSKQNSEGNYANFEKNINIKRCRFGTRT